MRFLSLTPQRLRRFVYSFMLAVAYTAAGCISYSQLDNEEKAVYEGKALIMKRKLYMKGKLL
jgi:hypothetical protein